MAVKRDKLKRAKDKSIKSYLESNGVHTERRGNRYWCSSPLSSDSVWSFCIYPNNTFYDWANGKGGDIIDLVSLLNQVSVGQAITILLGLDLENYEPTSFQGEGGKTRPFKLSDYVYRGNRTGAVKRIKAYADERKIKNYTAGKWMLHHNDNEWIEVESIMFKHYDENGKLTGAKFRTTEWMRQWLKERNINVPKFNSRGVLGWHILENEVEGSFKETTLYVMESETSATALHQYFQEEGYPAVIICFGGVNNRIPPIPAKYKDLKKYLLIDYDGDEEKFNERIKNISLKETEPLKLILEKGEDISSLYCREEMYKVSYLLR